MASTWIETRVTTTSGKPVKRYRVIFRVGERGPTLLNAAGVLAALAQLPDEQAVAVLRAAVRRR